MDGSQMGADLLKAVVSSKSNTTRDATGSGSRDREHGALSLFELSLHAQPHTQRLDLEFLLGLSGYQKVSLSPSFCPQLPHYVVCHKTGVRLVRKCVGNGTG